MDIKKGINIIKTQPRWKSKTAWLSLTTLILFVMKNYLDIEIPNVDKFVELLLITLSAFGIWNNPINKEGF